MSEPDTIPASAELVMRLHHLAKFPIRNCQLCLDAMSPVDRLTFLELAESQGSATLHDPLEDDPIVRPKFLAISEEVKREVEEEHRQRIAELEKSCPAVADLFRSGRGRCHRYWHRVKQLLRERYGIEWRTPAEMNPWSIFD